MSLMIYIMLLELWRPATGYVYTNERQERVEASVFKRCQFHRGEEWHFELLSFYNMDARLLKSCFGTYSEFIFLDFMTDLLVVPFCQLMF